MRLKYSLLIMIVLMVMSNGFIAHANKGYVTSTAADRRSASIGIFNSSDNTITSLAQDPNNIYPDGGIYLFTFMAMTPDGTKAYFSQEEVPSSIGIVDVATDSIIGTVDYGGFSNFVPGQLVITPDSKKGYVMDVNNDDEFGVKVIDLTTNTIVGSLDMLDVNASPTRMAVAPNGLKGYITDGDAQVHILDVATDIITGNVDQNGFSLTGNIWDVVFTPDSTKAYVAERRSGLTAGTIWIIDALTDVVIGEVDANGFTVVSPYELALAPDGKRLYVLDERTNAIHVVDTTSDQIIASTIFARDITAAAMITVNPENTFLYIPGSCASLSDCGIALMELSTYTEAGTVDDPNSLLGLTTQAVVFVPNLTPSSAVTACKQKNVFLTQTEYSTKISWQKAATTPIKYTIYRDAALTDFVGTTDANTTTFVDHNVKCNKKTTYYVVAVYSSTTTLIGSATNSSCCSNSCAKC